MINDYPPKPADYYMNLGEILVLCNSIESILQEMNESKSSFEKAEIICEKDAMDVDHLSIADPIGLLKNKISQSGSNASNAVGDVKEQATDLYHSLNLRYAAYLEELERERQRREADGRNA